MANKKKTTKKSAPKAAAPAKAAPTVTFKKDAKEGELTPQAAEILALVKSAGKIDRSALLKKMEGRVKTRQTLASIFSFYRKRLIQRGFITVAMA